MISPFFLYANTTGLAGLAGLLTVLGLWLPGRFLITGAVLYMRIRLAWLAWPFCPGCPGPVTAWPDPFSFVHKVYFTCEHGWPGCPGPVAPWPDLGFVITVAVFYIRIWLAWPGSSGPVAPSPDLEFHNTCCLFTSEYCWPGWPAGCPVPVAPWPHLFFLLLAWLDWPSCPWPVPPWPDSFLFIYILFFIQNTDWPLAWPGCMVLWLPSSISLFSLRFCSHHSLVVGPPY